MTRTRDNFLESPAAFLSTFGPTDPVFPAASDRTRHSTSSTQGALPNSLEALLHDCYFVCFSALVEQDYIGAAITDESATQAVFHHLRQLQTTRFDPKTRKSTHHTPSDILQSFLTYAPSLDSSSPSAIASWPASLAQQFYTNLSHTIQDRLFQGRSAITVTPHSQLTTLPLQLHELRRIAHASQDIYDNFSAMRSFCQTTTSTLLSKSLSTPATDPVTDPAASTSSPPPPPPPLTHQSFVSPAEAVLASYRPSGSQDSFPTDLAPS
eukprot:scaffold1883_cov92-Amphora_coffeaeformis.AAC.3